MMAEAGYRDTGKTSLLLCAYCCKLKSRALDMDDSYRHTKRPYCVQNITSRGNRNTAIHTTLPQWNTARDMAESKAGTSQVLPVPPPSSPVPRPPLIASQPPAGI
jgi:hypothetical protein